MLMLIGQITSESDVEPATQSTSALVSNPPAVRTFKHGCWAEEFPIPWKKMSMKLQKSLTSKKRVIPSEKRAMVCVLIDEMKNFDPNPRLEHAKAVARRVVSAYPDTFEDRTEYKSSEAVGCSRDRRISFWATYKISAWNVSRT